MIQKDYLLDTNIIKYIHELEAGGKSSQAQTLNNNLRIASSKSAKIILSPITIGEIEYGMLLGRFKSSHKEKYKILMSILDRYPCLTIDSNTARKYYSKIRAKLYEKYAPIKIKNKPSNIKRVEEWINPATSKTLQVQENDIWISALAWAYNLILVTDDAMRPIRDVVGKDVEFVNWIR